MLRGWDRMGYAMEVNRSGRRRARANGALVAFILKYVVAFERVRFSLVVEATVTKISATGETLPPAAATVHVPPIRRRLEGGTSPAARSKTTARIGRAGY